jgi:hypothetical protein
VYEYLSEPFPESRLYLALILFAASKAKEVSRRVAFAFCGWMYVSFNCFPYTLAELMNWNLAAYHTNISDALP